MWRSNGLAHFAHSNTKPPRSLTPPESQAQSQSDWRGGFAARVGAGAPSRRDAAAPAESPGGGAPAFSCKKQDVAPLSFQRAEIAAPEADA